MERYGLLAVMGVAVTLPASVWGAESGIDHAALIRGLDAKDLKQGEAIYRQNCVQCHGVPGQPAPNPLAASFGEGRLESGSDPFSMWQTLTEGYKLMLPQTWLTPEERYQVIHYIREAYFKPSNPSEYFDITEAYLDQLPVTEREASDQERGSMEYGPAMTYELEGTRSALVVNLTDGLNLYYDLHTMASPAAWEGGYVNLEGTHHTEYKGNKRGRIAGERLGIGPLQWAYGDSFKDPRASEARNGPVPDRYIDFHGHYLHGLSTILSYDVSGRHVLERPSYVRKGDFIAITHTLHIDGGDAPLKLAVAQHPESREGGLYRLNGEAVSRNASAKGWKRNPFRVDDGARRVPRVEATPGYIAEPRWGSRMSGRSGRRDRRRGGSPSGSARGSADARVLAVGSKEVRAVAVVGAPNGSRWRVDSEGRLVLSLPESESAHLLKVFRAVGNDREAVVKRLGRMVIGSKKPVDPNDLIVGGPRRWRPTLTTEGEMGKGDSAYVVDSVGIPFENPWDSWMRLSGLDFFEDGRCAVSTFNGDVWIVSGIDNDLDEVEWQRYATGLYEPLGVKIVEGKVHLLGRDRITRLHDLNGDGEADFYENFFEFEHVGGGYHAFTFGLDTDSQGNFYTVKSGRKTDYAIPGAVLRIAPDGSRSEPLAIGFRHPNGLTVGPKDRIYVSENQGEWIPASKVNLIEEGAFYGYVGWKDNKQPHDAFHRPIFWLPQKADNSSGGAVWATDSRWGPLSGKMVHTSYAKGQAFYVDMQKVSGVTQAGVVPFPWQFKSGTMRARINPQDGQVYIAGQKGWDIDVEEDGCLSRIRYTGKPLDMPVEAKVTHEGLRLRFERKLDREIASEAGRYEVTRWNYHWTASYGSPHYHPDSPRGEKEGEESLRPLSVTVGPDGKAVELAVPDHKPVDQVQLDYEIETADGETLEGRVYWTIKAVPGARAVRR